MADISALVERYAIRLEAAGGLLQRKANRIKTIRSSLTIEGNELSEDEVSTLVNGKTVIAPKQQLQEVYNAIHTYEGSPTWCPHSCTSYLTGLQQSEDLLLIRSCVFHYEFEFIHTPSAMATGESAGCGNLSSSANCTRCSLTCP